MPKLSKKLNKAFTLIELLIVIAIIGLLSSIVLASLAQARMKARDAKRIADLNQIRVALELYYNDYGYYPQSACGWDCNGYYYSTDSGWTTFATTMAPYINLPKDPINNAAGPWNTGNYSYAYGNVGKTTYKAQYDLTTQLEDPNNPNRCAVRNYVFYFDNRLWCNGGGYSSQIYEASN